MRRPFLNQLRLWTASAIVLALAGGAAGTAAAAEQATIFDWGDNDKTVDSGKAHIKFDGPARAGDIIVSFGDRKLYYITGPGEADTYPVAIPRDQARWQGVTRVTQKRENPAWTPTPHMLTVNPRLPRWVPGGHPMNPLGVRAMYLGSSDYRIHGTDAPWTIGTEASSGCVRMFNKDVLDLYPKVKVGAKVTVTWEKFDSKTLAMAERAVAVSDPDPDHGYAAGRVEPAALSGDEATQTVKGKVHKAAVTETVGAIVDNSEDKASLVAPAEQVSEPRRKYRSHKPTMVDADSSNKSGGGDDQHSAASETKDTRKAASPGEAAVEAPAKAKVVAAQGDGDRSEQKQRRSARRVPVQDGDDEAAALVVAKRAVAAAEKAAQAAERAAAAAERAAAVTQGQDKAAAPAASSSDPASSAALVKSY